MEESILSSIKQPLNVPEEETGFDSELVMLVNSALSKLCQLGVGPSEGFSIEGPEATWSEFVDDDRLSMVKEYVYLDVKLAFDPPTASALSSFENRKKEVEWRALTMAEDISSEEASTCTP